MPAESFKIGHLKKDAVWSVEPRTTGRSSRSRPPPTTARAGSTAPSCSDLALNLKSPVIYDTVREGPNGDERVLNPTETQAAREKQKLIKEKFKAWIFADPDRTERLVRDYNDTYNNLRPRLFDGSHLDFPGMSKAITLKPHQVDAVWRCMTGGNTLLAHAVGAGKSFLDGCRGDEDEAGRAYQEAAHRYSQPYARAVFAANSCSSIPNAKLLVAGKEDFTKDRRKMILTAKIATGDWDAIIVTHSSFERIGMSKEFQERFLRDQIKEYEELLIDKASTGRNIIKTLEKQKARREEKLKTARRGQERTTGLSVSMSWASTRSSTMSPRPAKISRRHEDGAGRGHPDRWQRTGIRPVT